MGPWIPLWLPPQYAARGVERLRCAQMQANRIGRGVENTCGVLMAGWLSSDRRLAKGLKYLSAAWRYTTELSHGTGHPCHAGLPEDGTGDSGCVCRGAGVGTVALLTDGGRAQETQQAGHERDRRPDQVRGRRQRCSGLRKGPRGLSRT